MAKAKKQTKTSSKALKQQDDRRPQLMKELEVPQWANLPIKVLEFLTCDLFPPVVRVYFLIVRMSWGYSRKDAISGIKHTKYGHEYARPLLQTDIAKTLGMDQTLSSTNGSPQVSKAIACLERIGLLEVQGKRLMPVAMPVIQAPKKLSDETTSWAELPIYQRLEILKTEYRTELQTVTEAAAEPVHSKYRPMIAEVNSEFKAAKREARKQRSEAQSATKLEKVVQPDNFSKPTSTISTDIQSGNADTFQKANPEKVVQPDNFSKLSPLEKVVSSDNFQPRIKYIGNKKGKTDKKTARGRSASKDELDGRTDGKADRPTDQLTDYEHAVQQAIIETGIPAELGDTPGPAFCKEAARRLNGAPVQWLKTRMKARRKAIIENGLGLILNLCDDAAKTYRDLQNRAKPPASETRALDDPLENLITDLEFYRACPEHPDANGEALQKLQKDNPELYAAAEAELQRRNQQAQGAIA